MGSREHVDFTDRRSLSTSEVDGRFSNEREYGGMVGTYDKGEGRDVIMSFTLAVKIISKLLILSNIEVSGRIRRLRRPSSVLDILNIFL